MSVKSDEIVDRVRSHYLNSGDFNGLPVANLTERSGVDLRALLVGLGDLVEADRIALLPTDYDVNTHINRLGFPPKEDQLAALSEDMEKFHSCLYPSSFELSSLDLSEYCHGTPYTEQLARGAPQLEHRNFDLSVLEHYRNDPRYWYWCDDVNGTISVKSTETSPLRDQDQVVLHPFGFSHDGELNRAIAVFLCDLSGLTAEHQRMWQAKELAGDFKLHPAFYRATLRNDWDLGISICEAIVEEISLINALSKAMGRPSLFRNTYSGEDRPKEFGLLIRPTLAEYNSFCHLLDKMLSDNINKDFFRDEVSSEQEQPLGNGRFCVQQKGTITMLDEWIRFLFRTSDWRPLDDAIAGFREVRRARQQPAHNVDRDRFDQDFLRQQRHILDRAYSALHVIRTILSKCPTCCEVEIPTRLQDREIWMY